MTLGEHIARSMFVAIRFLIGDTSALKFLEVSGRSVLRSFSALIFALPVFFILTWLQFRPYGFELFDFVYIAALFAGYALAWVGFAVIIFYTWLTVGPRQNYLAFLPLYNWARIFAIMIMVPYFALRSFGVIDGVIDSIVLWFSLALALSYKYRITRVVLQAPAVPAVLFVIFDLLLILFMDALAFEIFGIFGKF